MNLPKSLKNRRVVLMVATAALAFTSAGWAGLIPGVPDIVIDPAMIAKIGLEIEQVTQIVQSSKSTLASIEANAKQFSFKNLWRTVQGNLQADNVHDLYGETAGWNAALNTNSPNAAGTAWTMANVQVDPGSALVTQTPGTSANLTSLAMVEAFDSSSPNCMNSVGQYRSFRTNNAGAQTSLENSQLDASETTNSQVEQLNLLNAASAQQMHEMQSQGAMQACLVEQTTISNMVARNAAAVTINDASVAQQQRTQNNAMPASQSTTWQTFIP